MYIKMYTFNRALQWTAGWQRAHLPVRTTTRDPLSGRVTTPIPRRPTTSTMPTTTPICRADW